MTTTYLNNASAAANYAMPRQVSQPYAATRKQTRPVSLMERIDQGLLMVGIFLFLVPTMFTSAAFGLQYLLIEDVIAYKYYILLAAFAARVTMAILMKGMAEEKNRSQSTWITLAMIFPALSLICISIAGNQPAAAPVAKKSVQAVAAKAPVKQPIQQPVAQKVMAREVFMPRRSQAI